MSTPSPSRAPAGSRRFWITVLAFALANTAAWFVYYQYARPKLHLPCHAI